MLAIVAVTCAAIGFGELAGAMSVFVKIIAFPAITLAILLVVASFWRSKTHRKGR